MRENLGDLLLIVHPIGQRALSVENALQGPIIWVPWNADVLPHNNYYLLEFII